MAEVAPANEESTEAWSGPLFERFVRFRPYVAEGLGRHGEAAMAAHPPRPGDRVLDIGCGFGDTTRRLAELVGAEGEAVGIDVAEPFVDLAAREAAEAGAENVSYRLGDVQIADLGGPYDYVFSRMGVMFFANPVQALRNVRGAMGQAGGPASWSGGASSTTVGSARPSRWWSAISSTRRRPRSRPAGRARSRWPTPTWSPSS
jgi:SAM-dependent methyltransferase